MLCVVELSVAGGVAGCSAAGGVVLSVVVLSVPLSLQAATPSKASAETEARISFFISLSFNNVRSVADDRRENAAATVPFRHIAFRPVIPVCCARLATQPRQPKINHVAR
jgi:hypothetical protein